MQAALDSTALMVAKDLNSGTITTSQISTAAQAYFSAMYHDPDATSATVSTTYTANAGTGSTIQINGSGAITTAFMNVVGFPTMNFGTTSTASWGNGRMRVAMALDNTGSMGQSGKIAALRTAASNLVDQLRVIASNPGDVYISVVPFAKDVNVGASNYNQSWIDWTDWEIANGTLGSCSSTSYTSKSSCVSHGQTWTFDHTKWTGCVTDRTQPYDTQDTTPAIANVATLFPAEQYSYCRPGTPQLQQIAPLTYDWTSLKTMISAMQPTGNTDQSIGLAWAWQTLKQTAPMNAPAEDPNYTYKKAIILLSDGLNTQNRWTSTVSQIDARQKILCDNIKAQNITIYTIQVDTSSPPDPTSSVLQYCASGADKFYLLYSASQVIGAFNSIGTSLSQLHLSK